MGTYTSALVCHKCDKARQKAKDKQPFGRVLPSDLTNEASDWVCDSCGDKVKADVVTGKVAKIKAEAERLDADPKVRNQGTLLPQIVEVLQTVVIGGKFFHAMVSPKRRIEDRVEFTDAAHF